MKLLIKLGLVALVLSLSAPMWLKGPSGKPLMTPADWAAVPARLGALATDLQAKLATMQNPIDALAPGESAAPQQYYRWQDEAGVWHFSDSPPPEGSTGLDRQDLPELSNRMGEMPAPPAAIEAPESPEAGTAPEFDSSISPLLPEGVSREAIEELLDDAHERRLGEQL